VRVLVTGATGFIGSHTARALLAAGHAVRVLARTRAKAEHVLGSSIARLDDVVVGDMTDPLTVQRALAGCDAVVHAAALVSLRAQDRAATAAANRRGTELVVGGAARAGLAPIVYVSSTAALFRPGSGPVGPDGPVNRVPTPYARSKVRPELFVRALQERGAPIATTYPSAVIGPEDPGLSEAMRGLALCVNEVTLITSTGQQLVDVRDVAAVHQRLLEQEPRPRRYVVAARFLPWRALADLLSEVTGLEVRRLEVRGELLRLLGSLGDALRPFLPVDERVSGEAARFATAWPQFDARRTARELGIRFREPRESIAEALRWLVAAGHVEERRAPRLAPRARRGWDATALLAAAELRPPRPAS
jgi:nucleoside-diphosphate-sugar epimerase